MALFLIYQSTSSPRLNPLLSLLQTKTLILDLGSSSFESSSLHISSSRTISHNGSLPLDLFRVVSYHRGSFFHALIHSTLLPHLNPLRLEYATRSRKQAQSCWTNLDRAPVLSSWNRLQSISFEGILPYLDANSGGVDLLAALPPPSLSRRRIVRLHLSTLLYTNRPDPLSLLTLLIQDYFVDRTGLSAMQDGSVILVVQSERERFEVDEALGLLEERRRALFAIELKDAEGECGLLKPFRNL